MQFRAAEAAGRNAVGPGLAKGARRGFTIMEMLVVIAVIGILAALVVGALPALQASRTRNYTKAKLAELETAIENYKQNKGFYPPANDRDPARPPLVYELAGTMQVMSGAGDQVDRFVADSLPNLPALPKPNVSAFFGMDGFLNSGPNREGVPNFMQGMNPSTIQEVPLPGNPSIKAALLTVPYRGPGNVEPNTFRYTVGNNATNNPGSFDLWVEVVVRGRTEVIGNWKD